MNDFLGTKITKGDKALRVHAYSHNKEFKKCTVMFIDKDRQYGDSIAIITEGNSRIGWTYPRRIIVQKSINVLL